MPFVDWNDSLSVGIDSIDADHRRLIALLNQALDPEHAQSGREGLTHLVQGLSDYARSHFDREERLMARCKYPGLEEHRLRHHEFIAKVINLQEDIGSGNLALTRLEIVTFLADWLKHHIVAYDLKLRDCAELAATPAPR